MSTSVDLKSISDDTVAGAGNRGCVTVNRLDEAERKVLLSGNLIEKP